MIRVLLVSLSLVAGGCAYTVQPVPSGTCLSMAPYFPDRTRRQDHPDSKREAYARNIAFRSACPEVTPSEGH